MISNSKHLISGFLLLLLLSACSMSGDVTPPPSIPPAQESQSAQPAVTSQPVLTKAPEMLPETEPADMPLKAEESADRSDSLSISGQVVNASGMPAEGVLVVNLQGYEGMQPILDTTTEVDSEGKFRFENLENTGNRAFVISARYRGIDFRSNVIHPSDMQSSEINDIAITVFNTMSDTSSLVAERAHVFLDFNKPGQLQVAILMIISNYGEQIVSPDDDKPALVFELPSNAANLQFEEGSLGGRFVKTDLGFADLEPIYPGLRQHEVLFAYDIPYERKQSLSLIFPIRVDSAIIALPLVGVRMQTEQLQETGQRDIEGSPFQFYEVKELAADTPLTLKLSGRIGSTGDSNLNLIVGAATLVVVVVIIGFWVYRKRQKSNVEPETVSFGFENENEDTLLDAIVALDDVFRSGGLPEAAYQQRRTELKDRLKTIKNKL